MRQPDNVRKHLALASITVAVLIAAFLCYLSIPTQTPASPAQSVAQPAPTVQQSESQTAKDTVAKSDHSWPVWGGAVNSAAQDGSGSFDRQRARDFAASIDASEKKYILELNARSLLPLIDAAAADVFGENVDAQTVYLQFKKHPTDEQRENLKALGIELLSYVSGYAWAARGTPAQFQAARQTGRAHQPARQAAPGVYSGHNSRLRQNRRRPHALQHHHLRRHRAGRFAAQR
jgi:hypothetical protein